MVHSEYGYRRKPGMFPTYAKAAARISAWLLLAFSMMAVAVVIVSAIIAHPGTAMRVVFAAGLVGGSLSFARLARDERSRGMRIFGWFIALDMALLAANVAGVL